MTESGRVTLAQVAAHAGVSTASVSRILNGQPATASMQERVERAIAELNYVPDAFARSLRAGRTLQIAVAVSDIGNPTYVAMVRAIESAAREQGYRVVLFSSGADAEHERRIVDGLRNGTVDGLILQTLRATPALLSTVREIACPVVVIGNVGPDADIDNVRTNSGAGIALAVQHLLETGRKQIALLNGPVDTAPGAARRDGFESAMRQAGARLEPDLSIECADFTHQAGYAAAQLLLEDRQPDGIVCANDLIAMGALRALAEIPLRVPAEVAVTGMDDTDLAAIYNPPLTSVSLGAEARALAALDMLLARIREPDRPTQRFLVEPALVVRASSLFTRNRFSAV